MSIKENKAVIRRAYDLMNRGDLTGFFHLLAPEYTEHFTDRDMPLKQAKDSNTDFFTAFPDAHATIDDMVAEGDKVAVRETWTGTHRGEYMGIAATRKKINITNTLIVRIAGGKWAELWGTADELRLMRQLGAIPKM
ncbi:MAG: hypothetical protein A2Z29_01000 [Chloroflexi bacterium RBG_16_56_11]|nr:MAG: hypothetical protein A2Z29_01000 [Chloroflexi bacterium RBG_16_56_11]